MQLLHSAIHTYEIMWQAVTQLKGTFSPVLVQSNAHFFSSTFSMALSASAKSVKRTCIH